MRAEQAILLFFGVGMVYVSYYCLNVIIVAASISSLATVRWAFSVLCIFCVSGAAFCFFLLFLIRWRLLELVEDENQPSGFKAYRGSQTIDYSKVQLVKAL